MEEISVDTGHSELEVELASSLVEKSWGLSMRTEGKMLFVFSSPGRPPIDMMLVSRPLHLYFLDKDKQVIDTAYAEPWGLDPRTWKIYRPESDSKYLLESFEDLELERGDSVEFEL